MTDTVAPGDPQVRPQTPQPVILTALAVQRDRSDDASVRARRSVDRVLLDGTTLMFSPRLLAGEERPSALHLYALSLLVESANLHDQVIVLDTAADDRILKGAQVYGAGAVTVERRSVGDVVGDYVEREYPELEGIRLLKGDELRQLKVGAGERQRQRREAVDRAEWHLHDLLEAPYRKDAELQST
jgi:hypothetical protein